MPLYDYICVSCDSDGETFMSLSDFREDNTIECPDCGGDAYRPPTAGLAVGVLPSKPFYHSQTNTLCETNTERAAWEAEQTKGGGKMVAKDSLAWKRQYDFARNLVDKSARKRGYVDYEDQNTKRKKEQKRKQALTS